MKQIQEQTNKDDFETAQPVSKFEEIVATRDLDMEFIMLMEMTGTKYHNRKLVDFSKYPDYNRYSDILPYEDSRVKLEFRNKHDEQED